MNRVVFNFIEEFYYLFVVFIINVSTSIYMLYPGKEIQLKNSHKCIVTIPVRNLMERVFCYIGLRTYSYVTQE